MVAAQVVLSLSALMAMLAVVADGGLLLVERRHAQATADAAALAAASDLYFYWYTNSGLDPGGTASASAMGVASANGYTNDGTTSTVMVNIPPSSSVNFNGKPGYAEVIVTWNQQRFFSGIVGSGAIPVSARAVARGVVQASTVAVLLLSSTTSPAVTGGPVVVDPASQLPDFLSYLPSPVTDPPPGISVQNLPTITNNTVLTSNTIYIAPAGGLSLSGPDSIQGANVMIFVPSGSINLTGTGAVTLSPMTTGPYAGVTIFQDRSDTNGDTLVGNGNLNITGSIYAPAAIVNATANTSTDVFGSQIIAQSLTTQGSGTVNVNFGAGPSGTLRNFGLVE
jgi:hypothetical protein